MSSDEHEGEFYAFREYEPSEAAAIIFSVAFTIVLVAHVFQAIRARSWLTWALIVSVLCEVVGYVLREYSIRNRTVMVPYIISQVVIIVAPALLCGNLYMFVGRAMGYVGPTYSLVRHTWITGIFVGLDVLSIATQAFGSSLLVGNKDPDLNKLKLGRNVLILGLFIQLIAFFIFLFFTLWFDVKSTRALGERVKRFRWLLNAFYISGALIMIRSIYRAIEFIEVDFTSGPPKGYLYLNEWPYYVLDALPILIASGVFNIWFPPDFIPKNPTTTLDKERIDSAEDITELSQVRPGAV